MDLAELWRSTELPAERHCRLRLARAATRREQRGKPLTGAWYWLPTKAAGRVTWKIEVFFDAWLPGSDHVYIWRHAKYGF